MLKLISRFFLWSTGWTTVGAAPAVKKYVLVAAPHTSNWDLVYMIAFGYIFGVKYSFLAKHTLFWWPLGVVLRFFGGMPVDRRSANDLVAQMKVAFDAADSLVLVVPPEGTRARRDYWKSGFYHIARGAGVPIVLAQLDWGRKQAGFGPTLHPTGDLRADMNCIRAFYRDKQGKFPDQFGPVRLKDEDRLNDVEDVGVAAG